MVVVLLGPPGVGKGTQGALLAEDRRWRRIVTGDLLRTASAEGTSLGLEAKRHMEKGELVPDELIVALVKETLEGLPDGEDVLFDGFPRTVAQAESLDEALPDVGRTVDAVIVLEADDDVLVKRLSGRRSCPRCGAIYNVHFSAPKTEGVCDRCGGELVHRKDDVPETVRRRLEVYRAETEPLIRFYERAESEVVRVDGNRPVGEIQAEIRRALDAQEGAAEGHDPARPGGQGLEHAGEG